MALYEVTGPQGEVFEIEGPDDADPTEVIAQISGQSTSSEDSSAALKAQNPAEYDSSSPEYQAKYGALSGSNAVDNFLAGTGKAFVDLGRGAGQLLGLVSNQDVAESRQRDAPLLSTTAGKVGNIAGNVAATAPALFIPGANTVAGAGVIGTALGGLQPAESTSERLSNAAIGGTVGAVAQGVGGKVSNWAQSKMAARTAQASTAEAQNAVRDATLKEARKVGYVVPPSSSNPTALNRAVEGISGKAATQQSAAVKNQQVTNRLVRKALGLPSDAPLTKTTLNTIRSQEGHVYKAVKGAGRIVVDDAYVDDLAKLSESVDEVAKDFPELNVGANKEIHALTDSLLKDSFDSGSAVELMKQLRKEASSNLSFAASADPAKKALGMAQRDAAGAVEDMLIRHLENTGKGALAKRLDIARVRIAKTYSVEAALNESTGNIVAAQLGGQLKRGKPLSGELELAAKFARAFPKAAAEVRDSPGVSALDAIVAGVGGSAINPALFGLPLGRIATREALLSKAGQAVTTGQSYVPGRAGSALLQIGKHAKKTTIPSVAYATQQE
jgi:hypothetical protein